MAILQTPRSKIIFGIVAFFVVAAGITVGIMAATGVFKPKSKSGPQKQGFCEKNPSSPLCLYQPLGPQIPANPGQVSGVVAANIADEHDLVAP